MNESTMNIKKRLTNGVSCSDVEKQRRPSRLVSWISPDFRRTFAGLSPDFRRTFAGLSPDFRGTFAGLSPDLRRTFAGVPWKFHPGLVPRGDSSTSKRLLKERRHG
ncbi:Hypothetical predicted protein [Marmota monax]|uniref:Uncharacterized protein n=1 Tax=Marmota monax TaxID=9995 RepID=A0A5E4D8I0_MARMO|nr:Hypothetical predicted protein [Marmota monax]